MDNNSNNRIPPYGDYGSRPNMTIEEYEYRQLQRRIAARKRQLQRDRLQAYTAMFVFGVLVISALVYFIKSGNDDKVIQTKASASSVIKKDKPALDDVIGIGGDIPVDSSTPADDSEKLSNSEAAGHNVEVISGLTYIDDILIVNKTYSIPSDYNPGLDDTTYTAFYQMIGDAYEEGIVLFECSGFRSYQDQSELYQSYVNERGEEEADYVSSKPGHSEHQAGLAIDVNTTDFSFEGTTEQIWLENHCTDYGFIIRYPKGKEDITGYAYEPWHIRYVGIDLAKDITEKNVCLEEYLNISSDYDSTPAVE